MDKSNSLNVLKDGFFTIPLYYYKLRSKFQLEEEEFIFLMYLINYDDELLFNPSFLSEKLGIELKQVMMNISKLSSKGFLEVKTVKNDKNILEDYIILDLFYEKVANYIRSDFNSIEKDTTTIYETFEKELGKPLTPMEYEIINAWLNNGTSEEIIVGALKEAVFNGVFSLRYIDKIIFEWNKKGFKTLSDVDNNRGRRFSSNTKSDEKTPEVFDFDWLENKE